MRARRRAAPSPSAHPGRHVHPRDQGRSPVRQSRGHRDHPVRRARKPCAAPRSRPDPDGRTRLLPVHARIRIPVHGNASQSLHSIVDRSRCVNDISERRSWQSCMASDSLSRLSEVPAASAEVDWLAVVSPRFDTRSDTWTPSGALKCRATSGMARGACPGQRGHPGADREENQGLVGGHCDTITE